MERYPRARLPRPPSPAFASAARPLSGQRALRVDLAADRQRHEVYYEECGRRDGKPAVVLHGGPGRRDQPDHAPFFRSEPLADDAVRPGAAAASRSPTLRWRTTVHLRALIEDIERLRVHMGVEKWCVFGGSWARPWPWPTPSPSSPSAERVESLVLRGVFLLTEAASCAGSTRTGLDHVRHLRRLGRRFVEPDPAWPSAAI